MKKEEKEEILGYAEHFDGDLKNAAAAKVFGLGVVKMKKGIPDHASDEEKKEVERIAAQLQPKPAAKKSSKKKTPKKEK